MSERIEVFFGRLSKDPELKYTKKREAVCNFSIAIDQGKDERPIWKKVAVWGKEGEACSVHLKKGNEVFVRGPERERSFFTKEGETKTYKEVSAWAIGFVDR